MSEVPNPTPGSPKTTWAQLGRRKSSRILGKSPALPEERSGSGEGKRKPGSVPGIPGSAGNGSRPMLKLANLRLPHGRKRGAEVLAAEIVHETPPEGARKRQKSAENPDLGRTSGGKSGKNGAAKNPGMGAAKSPEKRREGRERKELLLDLPSETSSQSQSPGAETPRNDLDPVGIPNGTETPRNIPSRAKILGNEVHPTGIPNGTETPGSDIDPVGIPNGAQIPRNDVDPVGIPKEEETPRNFPNRAEILRNDADPTGIPRNDIDPIGIPNGAQTPGNAVDPSGMGILENTSDPMGIPSSAFSCEPHALNLLADLALGSCIPPFIPRDPGLFPAHSGNSGQFGASKPRSPRASSDHKYHRAEKQGKKATRMAPNAIPEPTNPAGKTSGILSPIPVLLRVLPARETPEFPESSKHSIISAEHSYALSLIHI